MYEALLCFTQVKRIILYEALLCFTQYGIEATTIEMIKKKSNISIGSIYHHFQNKEGILVALVFAAVDDLNCYREKYLIQAKNFEESIIAIVLSYVDWVNDHPNFAEIILAGKFDVYHSGYGAKLEQKELVYKTKLINWLSMPQNISHLEHIPVELIPSLILGITEHYCRAWLLGRVKYNPIYFRKELAVLALRLLETYK
ncbi:TetR/AcrR family transcriptional regulator [Acinetobacter stercoris]|uniref:HTH-type transcriptional repressor Bm3R1 n=1 Tax=Acinetobacter stercoris TaxID=2126983 RepID=A0A2U3N4R2_9GAMM|nr:TetR/AcrR family transcriptional regulator [Acinetobacter stercoris]SPL72667.1 HTH-type transcriptional repressor Bm3R1 [Acinetobacter stercoris]